MKVYYCFGTRDLLVNGSPIPFSNNESQHRLMTQQIAFSLNGFSAEEISSNGEFLKDMIIKDANGDEFSVKEIEFPILKETVRFLRACNDEELSFEIVVTDQENDIKHRSSDTLYLSSILLSVLGKVLFPDVKFSFFTVSDQPNDYTKAFQSIKPMFENTHDERVSVIVGPGVPAINNAIAMYSLNRFSYVDQYYTSQQQNGEKKTEVIPLNFFQEEEFSKEKAHFLGLFSSGQYEAAKE